MSSHTSPPHPSRPALRAALCALSAFLLLLAGVGLATPSVALPSWDTSPVVSKRAPAPTPRVVDLRWGAHQRFDRVVVDLRGKATGHDVRYVRTLRYDGSGDPVPLRGRRFIQVKLYPANAHNRAGDSVYEGPRLRRLRMESLRGVAFTGDFEAVVSFGLAVDRRAPFRVFRLSEPRRLVIDIRH